MIDSQHNKKSGIKKLLLVGERFYHKTLTCFRWIMSPLRRICTLFNILKPNVWVITGNEVLSRQQLVIIYAGREKNKHFLVSLAFEGAFEENYIGKAWLWKLAEITKEDDYNCSLMIAEVPRFYRILLGKKKCFYVPSWVSGEIDISSHIKKDSVKTDIRSIRKNRFHFEVTNDLSQLHNFYYNMYVPYIAKAHGNRAIILSYDYVKRQFGKRGLFNDLLLIKEQEEYIAGILLGYTKNVGCLYSVGIKDGNLDYVKDGAVGALFYFPTIYFKEKGYKKVNFGQSRAFLKDGVLQFKKKRSMQIIDTSKMSFLIKALSKTDGVMGFFLNNPFIYEDKTGLNGAIFVANNQSLSQNDFARIYKDYYLNGLSKLVIYQFDQTNGEIQDIVLPEYSDKITVRSAEGLFCTS